MLTRKCLLLAMVESVYGTDPGPTTGSHAIIGFNPEITLETDPLERIDVGLSLSRLKELGGKRRMKITFETELRGSGSAGTAPEGLSALFQACGMGETISLGVSVTYAPVSASMKSATIYMYLDGLLFKLLGCVGDYELSVKAGEVAKIKWTMSALYATPTDIAFPTSFTPDATVPVVAKNLTATFDAYAAIIQELTLKMNNTVAERADLSATHGIRGFQITDRNPDGTLKIESVLIATKNFFTKYEADTVQILSVAYGAVAGNICTITASQARIRQLGYEDADGIVATPIEFQLSRNSKDDELSIVFS